MRVRALALRLHPLVGVLTGAALLQLGGAIAAPCLRLLHTELYLGACGRALVGIPGLWLMLQGIMGLYLWWPLMRRPRWGFTIRGARPWPVVGQDLHKALGAASLVFHLPIAATGALLGIVALPSGTLASAASPRSPSPFPATS